MNLDDLGLLQKILLSTDGTVTDLVALYAGEEIRVHFELPEDAWFVSRTYLIHHGGRPLGAITEQWPLSWFTDGAAVHLEPIRPHLEPIRP